MTPARANLSETSSADVPWGRPAVDGIPLPPFADPVAHRSYLLSLQTFVALLDEGGPAAPTVALLAALDAEIPRGSESEATALSPLALGVSLATFFPAPWTPDALADALGRGYGAPVGHRDRWAWGGDPDYTAIRHGEGWKIERHERGSRERGVLANHGDLVLLWMDMFRNRFPYPIAHTTSPASATPGDLAEAARATRLAHAANIAMPYLQNWRSERDGALNAPPGGHGPLR
ncbi:hypothetical protein [Microbacterium testaceum]|uniref:hypothetical protein n=1 Tax=Microbacterium testaceum TaxID=2033 RepID=UPI00381A0ED9